MANLLRGFVFLRHFGVIISGLHSSRKAGRKALVAASIVSSALMIAMAGCGAAASNDPPPAKNPTISSFTPTSGNAGTTVVITGTNLTGTTKVSFNGRPAASFSVNSATQITAVVAAGTTSGKILIWTPVGNAGSTTSFTISNQPTITSFNPTSGAGGTAVTITGTNFTGATAVQFNNVGDPGFIVNSDTQISATVPGAATTGKISVATPSGSAASVASFNVILPAPTISSFSPTSGAVGASVVITGTNFIGSTTVKFNGTTATATVNSTTQITATVPSAATSGKITVTTGGGTATSATDFTVIIPAPTITSFNPTTGPIGTAVVISGTNFIGTTTVAVNGKAVSLFTVNSSTQIAATVASGSTSGKITVTTPGGTATSTGTYTVTTGGATLDLSIDGLYITQATQDYPTSVPLVQNRSAWVRVFVKANQANNVAPQVKVDFRQGATLLGSLTIDAAGASVPTTIDPTNASASWNAALPSAWIQTGVQVVATVDPTNAIPEADETNNTLTQNPDVRNLKQWAITLVPVKTADGAIGVVESGTRTRFDWIDFAKHIHPVEDNIDVMLGSTMTSSVSLHTSSDSDGSWETVLSEVKAKRSADGATNRYYFGAVHPNYTSGVAGMGYIGQINGQYAVAIGWDLGTTGAGSFGQVLAHEVGHNFGRQHSPCGNPAGVDPNYPYAGALIGVPGWDVFAAGNNLINASTYVDVMSYCSPIWISDYTYGGELTFRQNSAIGIVVPGAGEAAVSGDGLLVWGRIANGEVQLEPAFRIPVTNPEPQSGPYTWEARDAIGRVVTSVNFGAAEVVDGPDRSAQAFSFVVPLNDDVLAEIRTIHVRADNRELAKRAVSDATASDLESAIHLQEMPENRMQIVWDADQFPVLMLRDAKTGEVRGFLRGGNAEVEAAPRELELRAPDGTTTEPLRHRRVEP